MADDPSSLLSLGNRGGRGGGAGQLTLPGGKELAGRRFWLLGLAQAAHSIEETLARLYDFFPVATGWLHERIPAIPVVERMSPRTFAALNMTIIAVLLGAVPFVYARKEWALALAWVAACVEIFNGAGHLTGAAVFGRYVPGAATAPLLLLTGILLIRELRRS